MATHSGILAGKSHGQSSLVGYSPWGHKELDTTEAAEHAGMVTCAVEYAFLIDIIHQYNKTNTICL